MRRVVDQREFNQKGSSLARWRDFSTATSDASFSLPVPFSAYARIEPKASSEETKCLFRLLYRNALGQIARFVHVATENHREMIGEELERDRGENRHDDIGRGRHRKNVVGD